jgi:hypothetical protein
MPIQLTYCPDVVAKIRAKLIFVICGEIFSPGSNRSPNPEYEVADVDP